ncbi:hypothetical protein KJ641_01530 [Patescibacteria group bacterium]|nr:hypothetical protein [Patescibacteria group bacterium]MBU1895533.1 hypothetical protein [Patescibacteria group bacterium]
MKERHKQLLRLVVENYIQTGSPVGSKFLIEKSELNVSAATVRNEMRDLEDSGFLTHPHTSAGRIPTEQGYGYYVENIMKSGDIEKTIKQEVDDLIKQDNYKDKIKLLGKLVSNQINNAVIIAFGGKSVYYTGISNLFSQPEFRDYAHTIAISSIFDRCEEQMDDLYEIVKDNKTRILVGSKNPLGNACSILACRLNKNDLFVILGPMRMDYSNGLTMLNYIQGAI